jgi:hypothetical protein
MSSEKSMYVLTYNRRIVAKDASGNMVQLDLNDRSPAYQRLTTSDDLMSGFEITSLGNNGICFKKDGLYLCAEPNRGDLVINRTLVGPWETFSLISKSELARLVHVLSSEHEKQRFSERVEKLTNAGIAIKIYCGCGPVPRSGFLNLDIAMQAPEFYASNRDDYFIFPFADEDWGIPGNCIDYIFHEDFIEHIDQTSQYQFLAEALRVLKPDCWHRVNTPNINWTMKTRSDFTKGFSGVYTGERKWGHISIFSPTSLEEAAKLVGYRTVTFTPRSRGLSPHCVDDYRPDKDRDEIDGNIYADLRK